MTYSNHAIKRMQQRGIGLEAAEALCTFGSVQPDHHGGNLLYLDKKALSKLQQLESASIFRRLSEKPIYAVEIDGVIITIGHRYKKIHR